MTAVVFTAEHAARREFQCDLCYASIRRGARYRRCVAKDDDGLGVVRQHSACVAWLDHIARHAMRSNDDDVYDSTDSVLWMRLEREGWSYIGTADERALWRAVMRELDDEVLDEWGQVVADASSHPVLWTELFLYRTTRVVSLVAVVAVLLSVLTWWTPS